jgi:hypothetical protein
MKPAVFDEYLVGMHTRDNDSRKVDARSLAFQCLGIAARPPCVRLYCNSYGIQESQVGTVTGQCEDKVIS